MLILHGDNIVQSRKLLQEELDTARQNGVEITRLEAKKLSPAQLEEALGSSNLFGSDKLVIVEELHSLPTSQRKKDLTNLLTMSNSNADAETNTNIILWEKRALTATMLKPFTKAKVIESKPSNYLFSWLDTIGATDKKRTLEAFHKALEFEDEHLCFVMFIRQIRLLIQAKDNVKIAGPPFMITKLKKQAQSISLEKLLLAHSKLHTIDIAMKTSKLRNSVTAELDLIQLGM